MKISAVEFGHKLEEYRKANNLKQEELAEIVGTNYSRISRIERSIGGATMDYVELNKLIDHFGLSAEALMLRCEFIKKERNSGLATKIIKLMEEIRREYEEEKE